MHLVRLLKQNGLLHIRLHGLRHSKASYLHKLGFSPKEIQVWLGHVDISTMMDIYTHIDSGVKEGMAR
ncbi:MAG: tyrosine-type recombinase/integrase [Clostridia bacterium]